MSVGATGGSGTCQGPSQAWRDKMFAKADTDGNKSLSLDEFSAMTSAMDKRRSDSSAASRNTNSTGRPDAKTMFAKFDTNGDGALSQTELDSGMKSMRAAHEAVHKHKSGNSQSLVDMLFGNADPSTNSSNNPDDLLSAISGSTSASSSSSSVSDLSSALTTSANDSNNSTRNTSGDLAAQKQRIQQWMLNAFASQFNVSSAFATAA